MLHVFLMGGSEAAKEAKTSDVIKFLEEVVVSPGTDTHDSFHLTTLPDLPPMNSTKDYKPGEYFAIPHPFTLYEPTP